MSRAPGFFLPSACLAFALGCDSSADGAAQKSRVQAVLAEPGASPATPNTLTPAAEPAAKPAIPAKPRAPLCEGQLARKPEPFRPKRAPTQISMEPGVELATDPLGSGKAGKRWTWVNFWAAWCVPCKEELPVLLGWQQELAEELSFAFVSLDDDERQLREFLERQPAGGLRNTYWLPDGQMRAAWLDALHLTTEPELPMQLLIDASGSVRCRIEGAIDASDLAALRRILKG